MCVRLNFVLKGLANTGLPVYISKVPQYFPPAYVVRREVMFSLCPPPGGGGCTPLQDIPPPPFRYGRGTPMSSSGWVTPNQVWMGYPSPGPGLDGVYSSQFSCICISRMKFEQPIKFPSHRFLRSFIYCS